MLLKFKTERLTIRPFQEEDSHALFNIYLNHEVCKFLLHQPWTPENMREKFEQKRKNNRLIQDRSLSLAVLKDNLVVGDLSVWYTNMRDTVEIGYSFSNEVSGQGYATEAVRGLVSQLFQERDIHRIQATLDARNIASQKLCERIGMRKEAHFIQDFWNKGEWTDSIVYGMLLKDVK